MMSGATVIAIAGRPAGHRKVAHERAPAAAERWTR